MRLAAVHPGLRAGYFRRAGDGIGEVVAGRRRGIAVDGGLFHAVGVFVALFVVLRQVAERVAIAGPGRGRAFDGLLYRIRLRAHALQRQGDLGGVVMRLAAVHPGLRAGYFRHAGDGIGDGEAAGSLRVRGHGRGIAVDRDLLHAIDDLLAAFAGRLVDLVLRQVFKAPVPVGSAGRCGLAIDCFAVGQQLHRDARRPLAFLVVVVRPGLRAADVHRLRRMRVLHVIAGDVRIVTFDGVLGDRVFDQSAILIHGKIGEAPLPAKGRGYGLAGHLLAIGKEANGDACRPDAVLVVRVAPGLAAFHVHRSGHMRVRHVVAGDVRGIAFHRVLGDGVDDLNAAVSVLVDLVLRQFAEVPRPAIVLGHGRAGDLFAVGKQMDGDTLRTLPVLVVVIRPGLAAADGHQLRCMGVLHVIAGDGRIVTFNSVLGDGVDDLHAAFTGRLVNLVLRQIVEAPVPVGRGRSCGLAFHFLAVGQQPDRDAVGPDAVLVVRVGPGLCAAHRHRIRRMGVLHVIAGDGRIVTFNSVLGDGVDDLHAAFTGRLVDLVLRQIVEAPVPVGRGRRCGFALHFHAVGQQPDRDALRPDAVLVVRVGPGLRTAHVHRIRRMRVCHDVAVDARDVFVNGVLGDGVCDLLAVLVLIQVGERPRPLVLFGHGLAFERLVVGKQIKCNAIGPNAVLVVVIVPDLGHGDGDLLRIVLVRNGKAGRGASAVGHRILGAVHIDLEVLLAGFLDGVGDLPVVIELRQFLPSDRQRFGIDCDRLALTLYLHAICVQIEGHSIALAVLVIVVVPVLRRRNVHGLSHVAVGDSSAICSRAALGGVATDFAFRYPIHGFHTFHVLRKLRVADGVSAVAVIRDRRRIVLGFFAVHQQGDVIGKFFRSGPDAVLVVFVVPGLGYFDLGLFILISIVDSVVGIRLVDLTRCSTAIDRGRSRVPARLIVRYRYHIVQCKPIRHILAGKLDYLIERTPGHVGNAEPLIRFQIDRSGTAVVEPVEAGIVLVILVCNLFPVHGLCPGLQFQIDRSYRIRITVVVVREIRIRISVVGFMQLNIGNVCVIRSQLADLSSRAFDFNAVQHNAVAIIRRSLHGEPHRVVPGAVIRVIGIRIVRIVQRDLERKSGVFRSVFSLHKLLDRQIASAVVGGVKHVLQTAGILIIGISNMEIIYAFRSGRRIRLDQDLGHTVDDHRAVDVRRQIPAVTEAGGLDDRILMAGLLDLAVDDLAIRDVDLRRRSLTPGVCPRRFRLAHIDVEIMFTVPGHRYFDLLRFSGIDLIVPILDDRNGGRRQIHGFLYITGNIPVFHAVLIGEGGVQVGVGLQGIAVCLIAFDGVLLFLRQIFILYEAVVQVGDQVVRFLARPNRELDGIGGSRGQGSHGAQIPGNAIFAAVGGARGVFPFGERLCIGRLNIIGITAGLADYLRTDTGQGGNTVVHRDVLRAHLIQDGLGDLLEFAFNRIRIGRDRLSSALPLSGYDIDQTVIRIARRIGAGIAAVNAVQVGDRCDRFCFVCCMICRSVVVLSISRCCTGIRIVRRVPA